MSKSIVPGSFSLDEEHFYKKNENGIEEEYTKISIRCINTPVRACPPSAGQVYIKKPLSEKDFNASMRKSYWCCILFGLLYCVISVIVTIIARGGA